MVYISDVSKDLACLHRKRSQDALLFDVTYSLHLKHTSTNIMTLVSAGNQFQKTFISVQVGRDGKDGHVQGYTFEEWLKREEKRR
jgi:hypothetical protein